MPQAPRHTSADIVSLIRQTNGDADFELPDERAALLIDLYASGVTNARRIMELIEQMQDAIIVLNADLIERKTRDLSEREPAIGSSA